MTTTAPALTRLLAWQESWGDASEQLWPRLIPLHPGAKRPYRLREGGFRWGELGPATEGLLVHWTSRLPQADWGLRTGLIEGVDGNLLVVDVDKPEIAPSPPAVEWDRHFLVGTTRGYHAYGSGDPELEVRGKRHDWGELKAQGRTCPGHRPSAHQRVPVASVGRRDPRATPAAAEGEGQAKAQHGGAGAPGGSLWRVTPRERTPGRPSDTTPCSTSSSNQPDETPICGATPSGWVVWPPGTASTSSLRYLRSRSTSWPAGSLRRLASGTAPRRRSLRSSDTGPASAIPRGG